LVVALELLKLRIAACTRPLSAKRDAAPAALAAAPLAAPTACMAACPSLREGLEGDAEAVPTLRRRTTLAATRRQEG